MGARSGYRPELDGVRTFAIVGVLLFHAALISPLRLLGGEFGVDLFFVLSGLLITALLLQEHERTGTISLGRFFLRRALRLTPALVAMLVVGAVVESIVDANRATLSYPKAALAAFFAAGNWFQGSGQKLGILTHTWSLAIEWQFYLAWPAALYLALRRGVKSQQLAVAAAAGAVGVAVLRAIVYHEIGTDEALYWTITRCDGVLGGSALALAVASEGRVVRVLRHTGLAVVAVAGAGLGIALLRADRSLMYDGGLFALIACFVVVIGHVTVRPDGAVARALSVPPLPQLGRISYGVYLYHVVAYAPIRHDPSRRSISWVAVGIAVTIAAALISYVVIERPALRLKDRLRDVRLRRATAPA